MEDGWRSWTLAGVDGWAHHGVAVLDDGTVVAYHPKDAALLFFDRDGGLLRTVSCDAVEAHDIAVGDGGLWIADCGHKLCVADAGDVEVVPSVSEAIGCVLHVDLDGRTLRRIGAWHDGPFLPTGVAPEPRGVWIADGYGSNRVDLVAPDDEVLVTIVELNCPHGVRIDARGDEPRLMIAERGAHRIAVHDLDGTFIRHDGVGQLIAPCAMAIAGDLLYVADLVARVTVLDSDGTLITHLGADAEAPKRKGWPNALDDAARPVPPVAVNGRFNSPHGIAVTADDVIVTEWLLGGRWVAHRRSWNGSDPSAV